MLFLYKLYNWRFSMQIIAFDSHTETDKQQQTYSAFLRFLFSQLLLSLSYSK